MVVLAGLKQFDAVHTPDVTTPNEIEQYKVYNSVKSVSVSKEGTQGYESRLSTGSLWTLCTPKSVQIANDASKQKLLATSNSRSAKKIRRMMQTQPTGVKVRMSTAPNKELYSAHVELVAMIIFPVR